MNKNEQDLIEHIQNLNTQIKVWENKIYSEKIKHNKQIAAWESELQNLYAERNECEQELNELHKQKQPAESEEKNFP